MTSLKLAVLLQTSADLDAAVKNLYAVISGPAGQKRDWEAFRGMFADGAQMRVIHKPADRPTRVVLFTPDDYAKNSGPMLERDGFYEKEISRKSWVYGDMAQVWSSYEGRKLESDAKPFLRGINALTLAKIDGKWKVLSISWTDENSAGPIPKEFLNN